MLPLERDNKILIVTDIPARVCANCGEPYMTGATAREVEALANKVFSSEVPSVRVTGKPHILQASFSFNRAGAELKQHEISSSATALSSVISRCISILVQSVCSVTCVRLSAYMSRYSVPSSVTTPLNSIASSASVPLAFNSATTWFQLSLVLKI